MAGLLAAVLLAAPTPAQTQVFFNARLALRDRSASDALRLWLLRNSLRQRGDRSPHDAEFRSVVWAAVGDLGLCPDGFPHDDDGGARLWPLALHNQLLFTVARSEPPDQSSPFDSFEASRQQRFISLSDVLDDSELRTATFFPTKCTDPGATLTDLGLESTALTDRLKLGRALRALLELGLHTVDRSKFTSVALIESRLFDLGVELARLEEAEARQAAMLAAQKADTRGATKLAVAEVRRVAERWEPSAAQAEFLQQTLSWRPTEWLSLSHERRLALFARLKSVPRLREQSFQVALSLIDALIDRKAGQEVDEWIRLVDANATQRVDLVEGARGARLLELDVASGFKERAPIALARGVLWLERGERQEALRAFALALRASGDSRDSSGTSSLARRWLSYVLGAYETSDEVIATLKALVPPLEYNGIIEDLVWKAALRADLGSFDRLTKSARHGGAFDGRVALLRPLAEGKAGELVDQLVRGAADEPHATLRFIGQVLDHVEAEDVDTRRLLTPFLRAIARALDSLSGQANTSKAQLRRAEELAGRNQAILLGLGQLAESMPGKARALSPGQQAFAGNIRLAPADAAPWPFPSLEPVAPSPFKPVQLEPIEWRTAEGALVFGWRLSE